MFENFTLLHMFLTFQMKLFKSLISNEMTMGIERAGSKFYKFYSADFELLNRVDFALRNAIP